jgi:glycosyltransferase involved in cell wall biosynthesis
VSQPLNVAVVASELPYPPTAGGRLRTLNLALRLARRHRITFIAHGNDEAAEAIRFLREHDIKTVLVERTTTPKSGLRFYARLAANLASPVPYSVASHNSPALRRAVQSYARNHRVDVWQVESIVVLDALAGVEQGPKVVNTQNVESLIWQRYFEAADNPLKRWYIERQWRKFERFERRAFAAAARVVAVSEDDAQLIRDRFGGRIVDVVDNGIDRAYFEAVQPAPDPRTILFLGSLDWRPNLDAVGLLLNRVFPAVRAAEPSARLRLVGRKPPQALVRRVSDLAGVELHADVPDVRPFLATSGVMVVPLRIGGGSRLKILEAMAAGLPVVSTRVGAEGLELVPGEHYVAADEPEALAAALVASIREPRSARAIAERNRGFVLDRYDWDTLAERLEQVWFSCREQQAPSRVSP